MAAGMREEGDADGALLAIAMHGAWLSPGDAVELEDDDVTFPEDVVLMGAGGCALLKLAPGRSPAKIGRPQPAEVEKSRLVW